MEFSKKFFFILSDTNGSREKNILSSYIYLLLKNNFFFPKFFILSPFNYTNSDKNIFFTLDRVKLNNEYSYFEKITNEYLCNDNFFILESYYLKYVKSNNETNFYNSSLHKFIEYLLKKEIQENKTNDSFIFEFFNFNSFIDIIPFIELIKKMKIISPKNIFIFYFSLVPYLSSLKEFKLKPVYNSIKELSNFFLTPDLFFLNSRYKINNELLKNISFFTTLNQKYIINFCEFNNIYEFYFFLIDNILIKKFFKKLNIVNKEKNNLKYFSKKNKTEVFLCYLCYKKNNLINYNNILDSIFFSSINLNIDIKISIISLEKLENFNVLLSFDGIILSEEIEKKKIILALKTIKFIKHNNIPFLGVDYGFYISVLETMNRILKKEEFLLFFSIFKKKRFLGSHSIVLLNKNSFKNIYFYNEVNFEKYFSIYFIEKKYYRLLVYDFCFLKSFFFKNSILNEIFYLKNDFFLILQHHPESNSFLFKPNRVFVEFLSFIVNKKEIKK